MVAESFLYYLQELARSTSRGTCKEMSKCKVLRVCIPYGKASFGLGEGTIRGCKVTSASALAANIREGISEAKIMLYKVQS